MEQFMAKEINDAANHGVNFECVCEKCGLNPKGLVGRGDAIPIIYQFIGTTSKSVCFRCLEALQMEEVV